MVALGKEYAGLFSNDDDLAAKISEAGLDTGEKAWRLPLSKKYNKMIDSKLADIKNIGGRDAGSITAAQFLLRFVNSGTPWAHLDIAGTAMGSPAIRHQSKLGVGLRRALARSFLGEILREPVRAEIAKVSIHLTKRGAFERRFCLDRFFARSVICANFAHNRFPERYRFSFPARQKVSIMHLMRIRADA